MRCSHLAQIYFTEKQPCIENIYPIVYNALERKEIIVKIWFFSEKLTTITERHLRIYGLSLRISVGVWILIFLQALMNGIAVTSDNPGIQPWLQRVYDAMWYFIKFVKWLASMLLGKHTVSVTKTIWDKYEKYIKGL